MADDKIDFSREYLGELAKRTAPKWKDDMDEREQQLKDYSDLRAMARYLLIDINDHWASERLTALLTKLGLEVAA